MRITTIAIAFALFSAVVTGPAMGQTTTARRATTKVAAAQPAPKPVEVAKPKVFGKDDVVKLKDAGFDDDYIVSMIRNTPNKEFDADAVIGLRDAGFSQCVLDAIASRPCTKPPEPRGSLFDSAVPATATTPAPTTTETEKKSGGIGGVFGGLGKKIGIRKGDDTKAEANNVVATNGSNASHGIITSIRSAEACNQVKNYLLRNRLPIEKADCATGQISTEWAKGKNGGNAFSAASRVYQTRHVISFVEEGGHTSVAAEVRQRSHARGSDSQFEGDGKVLEKESTQFTDELRSVLTDAVGTK